MLAGPLCVPKDLKCWPLLSEWYCNRLVGISDNRPHRKAALNLPLNRLDVG